MIRDIGSEFWQADLQEIKIDSIPAGSQHFLVGRTALDFIIRDMMLKNESLKRVCLPSYCCHTMIKPFADHGLEIEFYNVGFENGHFTYDIDFDKDYDAILLMRYFGFHSEVFESLVKQAGSSGWIVIEDATHSWFSGQPYSSHSTYVFNSFRKWTGIEAGAIAFCQEGAFVETASSRINDEYIALRKQALELKRRYIENQEGSKEVFLETFRKAEEMIEVDYQGYGLPQYLIDKLNQMDVNTIKMKRVENCRYLIKELKRFTWLSTPELDSKDVPLFLPILINPINDIKVRDKLYNFLLTKKIYCPIHWPLDPLNSSSEHCSIYSRTISLICDQRYGIPEMIQIINQLDEYNQRYMND